MGKAVTVLAFERPSPAPDSRGNAAERRLPGVACADVWRRLVLMIGINS